MRLDAFLARYGAGTPALIAPAAKGTITGFGALVIRHRRDQLA